MPIYMDRHDVSKDVTAEHVAHLHQQDLNVQDKYHCKALTYWFDDERKTAFCLVDAPNKEAMIAMHDAAHGKIPAEIIEVEKGIVESFLGRIEDPAKAINAELNIINDPAFRSILVIKTIYKSDTIGLKHSFASLHTKIEEIIQSKDGRIVQIEDDSILISFTSVSNALFAAKELRSIFTKTITLAFGISAGIPVTNQKGFFDLAISEANSMCVLDSSKIIISKQVSDLYESENFNGAIDADIFLILQHSETQFLLNLMAHVESNYQNDTFTSNDFHGLLHVSKSQFYRKLTSLVDTSPNQFLKTYRLKKSLKLLRATEKNISEIAFLVGFQSPSHFSKSFHKQYCVSPTDYKTSTAHG